MAGDPIARDLPKAGKRVNIKQLQTQLKLDRTTARILGMPDALLVDSWGVDLGEWVFGNATEDFAAIEDVHVNVVRAAFNHPPYFTFRSTISYYRKSLGRTILEYPHPPKRLIVYFEDKDEVRIDSYEEKLYIRCNDNRYFRTHTHSFDVDFYDDVEWIGVDPLAFAFWHRC
jgi:hypothetical protein